MNQCSGVIPGDWVVHYSPRLVLALVLMVSPFGVKNLCDSPGFASRIPTRVTFNPQFCMNQLLAPIGCCDQLRPIRTNRRRRYIGPTGTGTEENYARQTRCGSVTIWRPRARPDVKVLSTELNWNYTTLTQ